MEGEHRLFVAEMDLLQLMHVEVPTMHRIKCSVGWLYNFIDT